MSEAADVIVVGGGIAGAGAAFELSKGARVVLLEREAHCGHHTTGRSAASFTEAYGAPTIRRLAIASRGFLEQPPDGFAEHPLLSPRGMLTIARADQRDALARELEETRAFVHDMREMTRDEALALVPILRPEAVEAAIYEPRSREIDVAALHQGFLAGARRRGARVATKAPVTGIARSGGVFEVETPAGRFAAPVLVNAAGAWADEVATMAGARPLGLMPKRRTALIAPTPQGVDARGWPLVNDVGGEFYFKSDAGAIFLSPADETPSVPMDAYPEDMDVAVAVDRFERATTVRIARITRAWAGLRTFTPDSVPAAGFDPSIEGLVWLAGQGGYGIKTSPALSRLVAALVLGTPFPDELAALGVTAETLSPARFA
jgi:D-arginine dehydrogenase